MPNQPPPSLPKLAAPRNTAFDPWNSSSTGHQRPEQQPGTSWRESRNRKLNSQFQSGAAGGLRLQDTWGPGADDQAKGAITRATSVADMLQKPGLMRASMDKAADEDEVKTEEQRGIFSGCVVYVNGSTYPLVSDHKLKHILRENGAQMSLHLGRRKVTHVILGRPAGGAAKGAGGGLAGGKMDREIRKIGGAAVRYVGVEW